METKKHNDNDCGRPYLLSMGESLIVSNRYHDRLLLFNVSPLTYVRELTELDQGPHDIDPEAYYNAVSNTDTQLFVLVGRVVRVFDVVWV